MSKDYYKILEVDKNSTADEIKKSYRKLAMKYHPDKNNGDPASEEKFKECAEAFEVLSDPKKKQEYDNYGTVGGSSFSGGGFDMNDIFSKFGDFFGFGGQQSRNVRRGNDVRVRMSVSINDIISGVDKKIKYIRQVKCKVCDGVGGKDVKPCSTCNGQGRRVIVQQTAFGAVQQVISCSNCNGQGQTTSTNCNNCKGHGTNPNEENLDVKIPKGAVAGTNFTMTGLGNWVKNGQPGDLHIFIEETEDNLFKREDNHLFYEHTISLVDAVLGESYEINTPNGNIKFNVTPGTTHGKTITIKGKGVPNINYNNRVGDLFIIVNIKVPTNLSKEEVEIFKELKKSKTFQ